MGDPDKPELDRECPVYYVMNSWLLSLDIVYVSFSA